MVAFASSPATAVRSSSRRHGRGSAVGRLKGGGGGWQLASPVAGASSRRRRNEVFNDTSFDEWVLKARAPALSASLQLYEELQGLGFQMILLTGRAEAQRNATEENLLFSGEASDIGKTAVVYKSERRAELEAQGYRIHGSSGDQWSDLLGSPMATRSFKLPNPLYHIP
ncbi:hypothetical protein J5N97_025821 [Dioscorea zingiberensis]|uniref:Acid phosphatase 1 n=1 Tax=Dioscorea zingiberensis TaxID=325984 RepID=A0A9D5H636_9LILI|nr:hypothetical protein J5N97_025821 [Dioscorea zingiberensis]